jgi:hypothetical protein
MGAHLARCDEFRHAPDFCRKLASICTGAELQPGSRRQARIVSGAASRRRDTSLLATLRTDLRQFAGRHRHISCSPPGRPFSLDLRVEQELHSSRACWAISRAGSSNSRRTGDHAGSFGRSGIGSGVSICSRRAVMKPVTSTKFGRVRRMDAMKGANRTRAARRGSMLRVGHRSRLAWMAVLLATGCQAVSPGAASVEFIRGGSCGIFQHWSGY